MYHTVANDPLITSFSVPPYETPYADPDTALVRYTPIGIGLLGLGADIDPNVQGMHEIDRSPLATAMAAVNFVGATAGGIAGAYHGYKRNHSVGWAIGWFFLGSFFWPITIPVMFAQGFAKAK